MLGKRIPFGASTATCPAGAVRGHDSFRDLADEVGESRIYIGFHFRSAMRDGANLGRHVGDWTFHRSLRPLRDHR